MCGARARARTRTIHMLTSTVPLEFPSTIIPFRFFTIFIFSQNERNEKLGWPDVCTAQPSSTSTSVQACTITF